MVEQGAINRIERFQKQWTCLLLLQNLALSLGLTLIFGALAVYLFDWLLWIFIPLFLIFFALISLFKPFWKVSLLQISRHLNASFPELEESAALLLKPVQECSALERLQQHKISEALLQIKPKLPFHKLGWAVLVLAAGIGMSFGISFLKPITGAQLSHPIQDNVVTVKEKVLPEIASFSLLIKSPVYTGIPEKTQATFAFKAAHGSLLKWSISTTVPVKVLKLIFNDKEVAVLKSQDKDGKNWQFAKTMTKPGFYQLELDGKKSELYMMTVIPDLPAVIKIIEPKPHTSIDFGQVPQVHLKVSLTDDYGLKSAYVTATMASGKGEGVSFTERKLDFNAQFNHQKSMTLTKLIDLKALGMKPGDELYFFVNAFDNLGQMSRSDVYFVSIVDTAELMSMAGMTNGVNLVPEYFRSQRQIIMDTEKLLAEKSSISEQSFKNRSNDLGMDQKLLRLRYGKFLGEESETEIGGDHDHKEGEDHDDHDHGHEAKETQGQNTQTFGDVKAIMDSYAHKHDVAEDATFFEPELKAQLKAVLTEMWKSELQLRTYKTRDALPFEYKALRLLKDLQQKSRAYVAKTTVKVTQLKEDKRLSGELDKIGSPIQKNDYEPDEKRKNLLKQALTVLENRKADGFKEDENPKTAAGFKDQEREVLKATEQYMIVAASDQPALYLPALAAGRKLLSAKSGSLQDIALLQKAIVKMLGTAQSVPQSPTSAPASTLSQQYFNHLKKAKQSNGF